MNMKSHTSIHWSRWNKHRFLTSDTEKIKEITKIQKKKDFIKIKKNMPENIFYKSILLTIEIIFNFLEDMLPSKLYIFLSKFRYTLVAINK